MPIQVGQDTSKTRKTLGPLADQFDCLLLDPRRDGGPALADFANLAPPPQGLSCWKNI